MIRTEYIERWSDFKMEYSNLLIGLISKSTLFLDYLPFKKTENGNFDLRGLNLKDVDVLVENQGAKLKDIVFQNCDFSFSNFDNLRIERCQFINCIFVSVYCRDLYEIGNVFNHCTFQKVDFRRALIGNENSKFNDCIFENCNFTSCSFYSPQFTNISFVNCNLRELDFAGSSFENCLFEGKMSYVLFRGDDPRFNLKNPGYRKNQMNRVSFEKLDFNFLGFSDDCNLDYLKLKSSTKYLIAHNFKCKTKELFQNRNQYTIETADFIEILYGVATERNQNSYLFNVDDWIDEDSNIDEINAIFYYLKK